MKHSTWFRMAWVLLAMLAGTYTELARYEDAERLQHEALEAQLRVLGAEHAETLGSMANLAELCFLQGRRTEAEARYREVMEIQRRALGPDHPDTLASIWALERILASPDRPDDAE